MGFSRQEYWSGLPYPPSGHFPNPGVEPSSLTSPALPGGFFTNSTTWESHKHTHNPASQDYTKISLIQNRSGKKKKKGKEEVGRGGRREKKERTRKPITESLQNNYRSFTGITNQICIAGGVQGISSYEILCNWDHNFNQFFTIILFKI